MAKRRYNKFGNSNDFYVEQNGICSNNRSKKYNTTVNCYDRNPGCHKIASDVEAIIQRMKMDFESKKSIDQQERNARIINADSYRVRQELEKEREKRERLEREKLEKQIAKEEARKITEILEQMDPLDRAIFEGKNRRSLTGSIYNSDDNKLRETSAEIEIQLKQEESKYLKEKNKKKIIILVLGIIGFILFALSWIPFIEFEIDKQNYEFMKGRNNHNWVYPFFVIFTILFFCFTLLCFFKTKSKNKPNSKTKINELRKKLEKAKQYEEKNKAALNSFKGINQLKVCINVIDQFGPFIDEMRKDGRTITILDKDKIVNELKNLYIVPVWFVTFIRILCSSNITLSKEEAVVIIDAMYDTRVKLHKEDEELKKFVDEKRKTLPEDIYKLQDYINSLNENEDRDFEEIYIACRIFFEKNYTFSGE